MSAFVYLEPIVFGFLTASFVPLATRGIGQHSANFAFLLFYLIVLALWDVAWIIMTAMVIKTSQRPLSAEEKRYLIGGHYYMDCS